MSVATGIAHAPAARGIAPADTDRDRGGHDHAPDRRDDRQQRLLEPRQLPDHQLTLQLKPGDEEEQREQPVLGPVAHAEVEVQQVRPDTRVADGEVGVGPRAVGGEQRDRRGAEQDEPAHGLGAQETAELGHSSPGVGWTAADQTSRRTAIDPNRRPRCRPRR
jgi:hypothetical protein